MNRTIAFALLATVALSGCQTRSQESDQALASQVPENYRSQVAAYFRKTLKDPYSVRDAEISSPTSVFVGLINGGSLPGVCVKMNGKNSFGAYIGIKTVAVSFQNGAVSGVGEPVFDTCRDVSYRLFPELMAIS